MMMCSICRAKFEIENEPNAGEASFTPPDIAALIFRWKK